MAESLVLWTIGGLAVFLGLRGLRAWLGGRGAPAWVPPLRIPLVPTPKRIDRLRAVAARTQGTVVTEGSRLGGHVRFESGFERRRRTYLFYEARPDGKDRSVISLRLPQRSLPRIQLVLRAPVSSRWWESPPPDHGFDVTGATGRFTPSEDVLERLSGLSEFLGGDPRIEVLKKSVRLSVKGRIPHEEAAGTFLARALSTLEELDDELQEAEDAEAVRVVAVHEAQPRASALEAASPAAEAVAPTGPMMCQICGDGMEGDTILCPGCRTPHHRECWAYFGGCSTYGCGAREGA